MILRLLPLAAVAVALGLGVGRIFRSDSMTSLVMTSCLIGLWFGRKDLRPVREIVWMFALTGGIVGLHLLLVQVGCRTR
jgi:hypothetical protein